MGERDVGIEDIFENWADIELAIGADASVSQEVEFDTGLALFGDRAWAIHRVEFYYRARLPSVARYYVADGDHEIRVAIGRPGVVPLAGMRAPVEGLICQMTSAIAFSFDTEGATAPMAEDPHVWRPSTPVPYARNKISFYYTGTFNEVRYQLQTIAARIAYTYIPATKELYRELQERWSL